MWSLSGGVHLGVFLLLHLDLGEWEPLKSVAFAGARLFEEFLRAHGAYSGFYPLCAPQKTTDTVQWEQWAYEEL